MSTRLKISDSLVFNADEIVSIEEYQNIPGIGIIIYLTSTTFKTGLADSSVVQSAIILILDGITPQDAIQKINKALIAAPSGSVVEANFKYNSVGFGNFEDI
jgi:hypothetical protein